MCDNTSRLINLSDKYIHLKSDNVPDWVRNLEALKEKIRLGLENTNADSIKGIKFCKPLDVPPSANQ